MQISPEVIQHSWQLPHSNAGCHHGVMRRAATACIGSSVSGKAALGPCGIVCPSCLNSLRFSQVSQWALGKSLTGACTESIHSSCILQRSRHQEIW